MGCCGPEKDINHVCQECHLVNLIDALPFKITYVEIGVLRGECIVHIAKHSKNVCECIGIDPYESYIDHLHGSYMVGTLSSKLNLEVCKQKIKTNNVEDKVKLILEDSRTAKDKFKDESIGVVYVDKSFSYDCVTQDVLDWWPKVQRGGYLTGHDWDSLKVKQAVIDTADSLGVSEYLSGEHNVWKIAKV